MLYKSNTSDPGLQILLKFKWGVNLNWNKLIITIDFIVHVKTLTFAKHIMV